MTPEFTELLHINGCIEDTSGCQEQDLAASGFICEDIYCRPDSTSGRIWSQVGLVAHSGSGTQAFPPTSQVTYIPS